MVLLSFIIGILVIKYKPNHNLETVFESNARYYPHINDETVLKKISKPKIAPPIQGKSPADSISGISGSAGESAVAKTGANKTVNPGKNPKNIQKKIDNDEFIPD